jgi:hypothetical protein
VVEGVVAVFRQGRDDDLLALVKIPARRCRAAVLGTGNRVSRDELADTVTECRPRRSNHVALGRAAVGDDGIRAKIRTDTFENIRHLGYRRGHQHDVGILDFVGWVDACTVDDAEFLRLAQSSRGAAETDDFLDGIRFLEGQRERAADQAGTKDDDFAEFGHGLRAPSPALRGSGRFPARYRW